MRDECDLGSQRLIWMKLWMGILFSLFRVALPGLWWKRLTFPDGQRQAALTFMVPHRILSHSRYWLIFFFSKPACSPHKCHCCIKGQTSSSLSQSVIWNSDFLQLSFTIPPAWNFIFGLFHAKCWPLCLVNISTWCFTSTGNPSWPKLNCYLPCLNKFPFQIPNTFICSVTQAQVLPLH